MGPWFSNYSLFACSLAAQAARRLARRALEAFPASPTCRLLHAQVLSRQPGRAGQAEAQLRQVLLEEPGDEEPALLLAVLLVQQGRHSEAEAILADQLATAPSMAGHVIAGRAAVERGDLEAAAGHFHAALGYSPLSELAAKVGPGWRRGIRAHPRCQALPSRIPSPPRAQPHILVLQAHSRLFFLGLLRRACKRWRRCWPPQRRALAAAVTATAREGCITTVHPTLAQRRMTRPTPMRACLDLSTQMVPGPG